MKRLFLILLIIAGLLESCKKYEDGPLFSLRSAKNRLYGGYTLTQYTVDGVDSLSLYNDSLGLILLFEYSDQDSKDKCLIDRQRKDGKWAQLIWNWKLIDHNKTLKIESTYGDAQGTGPFGINKTPEWEILKLTNVEVKMKTNFNGKEYLIDLK